MRKLEELGSIRAAAAAVRVGTGSVDWARKRDAEFAAEVERVLETWRGRVPVPMARVDGFTPRKRRRCIKTLARTGCLSDAARVAGVSRKTVNDWRAKDPDFAALCAAAIDKAAGHIETLAWQRAVTGIEEPVIHYGKQVGTRIKRSDSIFRMLLSGSNPAKYGRMGAVARADGANSAKNGVEAAAGEQQTDYEAAGKAAADSIAMKLERMSNRRVRDEGYVRMPNGGLALPGWGPVTEEAKQMAALPAEIWEEAGRRGVLPRPDGTVPEGAGYDHYFD